MCSRVYIIPFDVFKIKPSHFNDINYVLEWERKRRGLRRPRQPPPGVFGFSNPFPFRLHGLTPSDGGGTSPEIERRTVQLLIDSPFPGNIPDNHLNFPVIITVLLSSLSWILLRLKFPQARLIFPTEKSQPRIFPGEDVEISEFAGLTPRRRTRGTKGQYSH